MKKSIFLLLALCGATLMIAPAQAAKPKPSQIGRAEKPATKKADVSDDATVNYVDATRLTLINKAQPDGPTFQRIDVSKYPDLTPTVNRYYRFSTGLALVFRTDSPNIRARWKTTEKSVRANLPLIAQRGMDLYIRRDGAWIFAGVAVPSNKGLEHDAPIVTNMDETMKECLLYLPLFDEMHDLEIGIDEGTTIEPIDNPFRHRIVVIGSSITHGAAAGRPGMAYPARLERRTGMEFINLGASGQCKLDEFFATIAAETEADAFVFDTFSNPSAPIIGERLDEFVRIVRKAHPTTPLIFLQTEVRESTNFDQKKANFEMKKRAAARKGMQTWLASDKNIYFIESAFELGDDHEATVDGVHPTDLGFDRVVKHLEPELLRILKKYDIHN